MANTLITPEMIADMAIANLYDNAVMAGLVNRNYENEFVNQVGDTVNARVPTTFEVNDFDRSNGSGEITVQAAEESSVPIKLDKFKDVSFAVTSEDWTLNVQDFNQQFVTPAMNAINQQIDKDVLSLQTDVTAVVGNGSSANAWNEALVLTDAMGTLDGASVPRENRRMVADAQATAKWVADPIFHQADKRGGTAGLTNAEIGRKFTFDNYMDQNAGNTVNTNMHALAFHRDAFTLVTRPLAPPRGASNATTRSYNGIGLRLVYDYDIRSKQDIVSIDVLYGVQTLKPEMAVLVEQSAA